MRADQSFPKDPVYRHIQYILRHFMDRVRLALANVKESPYAAAMKNATSFPRSYAYGALVASAALVASFTALWLSGGAPSDALAQGRPAQPAPQQPPAQSSPPASAAQPQQPTNAPVSGWQTRCVSAARKANMDCMVEQAMTLPRTSQTTLIVNLRISAEGQQPTLNLRLPLGVTIASGVHLRVDAGNKMELPIRSCDPQGCNATASPPAEFITALRGGKQLNVEMKANGNQDMDFVMPLDGFGAAYERVK